jgi:acetyltransferase-like isoleucine patch superfamily enzyme
MPGVTIGENTIIGAFSFVNKDVPSNVVAAGVPVKLIKKIEGE